MYAIYLTPANIEIPSMFGGFIVGGTFYHSGRKTTITTANSKQRAYIYETKNGAMRAASRCAFENPGQFALIFEVKLNYIDRYNSDEVVKTSKCIHRCIREV